MAQLVENLPSIHKVLGSIPNTISQTQVHMSRLSLMTWTYFVQMKSESLCEAGEDFQEIRDFLPYTTAKNGNGLVKKIKIDLRKKPTWTLIHLAVTKITSLPFFFPPGTKRCLLMFMLSL